jgi:hypothetical protein
MALHEEVTLDRLRKEPRSEVCTLEFRCGMAQYNADSQKVKSVELDGSDENYLLVLINIENLKTGKIVIYKYRFWGVEKQEARAFVDLVLADYPEAEFNEKRKEW